MTNFETTQNKQENKKSNLIKNIVFIGTIIALILIIFFLLFKMQKAETPTVIVTEPVPIEHEVKQEHVDGQVDLPLVSSFSINANNQFKKLKNPSSNAGYYTVEYQFYYEGEVEPFFVSDKLEGGSEYQVNFFELIEETGTHNVNVIVQPYNIEDDTPCNNLSVNITVTKE